MMKTEYNMEKTKTKKEEGIRYEWISSQRSMSVYTI